MTTVEILIDLSERLKAFLYRKSNLSTGQTQGIVNSIQSRFPDKPVSPVTNGINVEAFKSISQSDQGEECKKEFGLALNTYSWQSMWKQSEEYGFLHNVHSQLLQQCLQALNRTYQNLYTSRAQPPIYRKKFLSDTFRYPQGFAVEGNQVYLPKIGWVCFWKSRSMFSCQACGHRYHSDVNAARNILALGQGER